MDREKFNELLEREFDGIRKLNQTKGREYATEEDVLADFHAVAGATGITEEQALLTYATKHWRAINSWAQRGHVLSEPIAGRIQDMIVYLLLLQAMVETKQAQPTVQRAEEVLAANRVEARAAAQSAGQRVDSYVLCVCNHVRGSHQIAGFGSHEPTACRMEGCECEKFERYEEA